ncbi:hypothetical protein GSI_14202 [Ganoderma sinense ZZ0214-1]|uniref:Uncharacterized protein n=1 Tax=Ganoderma sinense ZZ0214-1 TaxID=1077348 RepID=A0A2G8RSX6_9APHY|nr:hypothetical protein GSI_14202 [Ganoderma sinense ZZ0214-1]
MFADEMDILSLSRWRCTCRANYQHASSSLQRTFTNRLQAFVPYPHQLIDIVEQHGGIFGGEVALSFLLRHDPYRPSTLEMYTSHYQFDNLRAAILNDPQIRARIDKWALRPKTQLYALSRLVSSSLEIRMTNGRTVYVHQSYNCSPSAPLTRAPCTALSNFVTGYGFGCSHPTLTLARRALLADRTLQFPESARDRRVLDRLLAHGFELAVSPATWPEYRDRRSVDVEMKDADDDTRDVAVAADNAYDAPRNRDDNTVGEDNDMTPHLETTQSPEECLRYTWLQCPSQGRFFGDGGSFVGYFDPLDRGEERCMKANVAPYGSMAVWRVPSTFDCDAGCGDVDEVLETGVTSVPVLFFKDPFGELKGLECDRMIASARRRALSF